MSGKDSLENTITQKGVVCVKGLYHEYEGHTSTKGGCILRVTLLGKFVCVDLTHLSTCPLSTRSRC